MTDTPLYIRLPHGERNPRKRYSMPNPSIGWDPIDRVRAKWLSRSTGGDRAALARVIAMADGYLTSATLGQEYSVQKLRDIWRYQRREGAGS